MEHLKTIMVVACLIGFFIYQNAVRASSEFVDLTASPSEATVIQGEVLDIQENLYLIKTKGGQIARVRIYRGTVQDQSIVKGDKVEARVLPEWHALVLRQQH